PTGSWASPRRSQCCCSCSGCCWPASSTGSRVGSSTTTWPRAERKRHHGDHTDALPGAHGGADPSPEVPLGLRPQPRRLAAHRDQRMDLPPGDPGGAAPVLPAPVLDDHLGPQGTRGARDGPTHPVPAGVPLEQLPRGHHGDAVRLFFRNSALITLSVVVFS